MEVATFDPHSRSVLDGRDLARFPGDSLFERVARVCCEAGCLPRKELYESWEVARRVRRRMRGGRVVELAAGHGLVAILLLLLDDTSERAVAIDTRDAPSGPRLVEVFEERWPRLRGRLARRVASLEQEPLGPQDLVVSVHACGALTDVVLTRAMEVSARVAVLPCCHDEETCDTGSLLGFLSIPLAIDATRVGRLRASGYEVWTQTIPEQITPQNRLIMARPSPSLTDADR